jgi:type I restriction enzyme M protein
MAAATPVEGSKPMAKRHTTAPQDFHTLFLRLEELIAASSGADIFEESLKLVAAKLHSERSATPFIFEDALRGAVRAWPQIIGNASPALHESVAQQCAGLISHFDLLDAGESLDALFETLISESAKGRKGQYFTPRYVVELCLRLAQPQPHDRVLDPACGSGAFLGAALRAGAHDVRGIDIDERAVRVARLLMVARGADPSVIRHGDALRSIEVESADVVLSNPPFAGEVVDEALLATYELASPKRRTERDVLFLAAAVRALRPGGTLAIVLPHNKFAGRQSLPVRKWLLHATQVIAVVGLGRNTFLPHTHQKANVLLARKRTAPLNGKPEPIFFAQSERDGKDSRGAATAHDLDEIVEAFAAFRSAR